MVPVFIYIFIFYFKHLQMLNLSIWKHQGWFLDNFHFMSLWNLSENIWQQSVMIGKIFQQLVITSDLIVPKSREIAWSDYQQGNLVGKSIEFDTEEKFYSWLIISDGKRKPHWVFLNCDKIINVNDTVNTLSKRVYVTLWLINSFQP